MDRPWKFDQDVKAVFTVVTPVDLNFNVKAKVRPTFLMLGLVLICVV